MTEPRSRCLWIFLILIGVVSPAFCQTCTDYSNYLHWKSTVTLPGLCSYVAIQPPLAFVTADLYDGGQGFHVLSIEDPEHPSLIGSIPVPGVPWRMVLSGNYVYVSAFSQGLQVIDISNPSTPTIIGSVWTVSSMGLVGRGAYLFMVDYLAARLYTISVKDPRNPEIVAEIGTPGWAYGIALSGNLAVVTAAGGVMTVDLTDPLNPRRLGSMAPYGASYDVAIQDQHAIIVADSQVYIVDIADPTHPTFVTGIPVPGAAWTVKIDHGYAFVGEAENGMVVIDVRDPEHPVQVGHMYSTDWVWGVQPYKDLVYVVERYAGLHVLGAKHVAMVDPVASLATPGQDVNGIALMGDHAFLGDNRAGLAVADVSDPLSPRLVASYDLPGISMLPACAGNLLFLPNSDWGLCIFDIADPDHPALIGTASTGGWAYSVAVQGRYAYVANMTDGLCIVDVIDPSSPVTMGRLDLSEAGRAWGVEVDGDLAYVTDTDAGLAVVDVSDPWNPTLVHMVSMPFESQCVQHHGNLLYVGGHPKGLAILDISDPESPVPIGYCDTLFGVAMLRVKDQTAWLAEGEVQIADVSNPRAPRIVGYAEPPVRTLDFAFHGRYTIAASHGLQVMPGHCPVKPFSGPMPPRGREGAAALLLGDGVVRLDPGAGADARSSRLSAMVVFDASGRIVRSLAAAPSGAQTGNAWDGRDETGRRVPSGVYFVRGAAGSGAWDAVRRILVLR